MGDDGSMPKKSEKKYKINDRTLEWVVVLLVLSTLGVSLFLEDEAYTGALAVALPTTVYVQWCRWRAGKKLV